MLQNALCDVDGVVISITTEFDDLTDQQVAETLRLVKTRARILVVCLAEDDDKRRLMLTAFDYQMVSADYVFLFVEAET